MPPYTVDKDFDARDMRAPISMVMRAQMECQVYFQNTADFFISAVERDAHSPFCPDQQPHESRHAYFPDVVKGARGERQRRKENTFPTS